MTVETAGMFRLGYESPRTTAEFVRACRAASARDGSTLIEVETDREKNVALHCHQLAQIGSDLR